MTVSTNREVHSRLILTRDKYSNIHSRRPSEREYWHRSVPDALYSGGNRQPRFDMSTHEKPSPSRTGGARQAARREYPLYRPHRSGRRLRPAHRQRERVRRLLEAGHALYRSNRGGRAAAHYAARRGKAARLGVRVEHHRWPLGTSPGRRKRSSLSLTTSTRRCGGAYRVRPLQGGHRADRYGGRHTWCAGACRAQRRWRRSRAGARTCPTTASPLVERQRELVRRWSEDGRK